MSNLSREEQEWFRMAHYELAMYHLEDFLNSVGEEENPFQEDKHIPEIVLELL